MPGLSGVTAATSKEGVTATNMATPMERDRDEATRSAAEARRRTHENLTADPRNVQRYVKPPGNALHPLEYAYHLLGDIRGKTVLDYGCGAGENSILLAYRGAKVIGLDISPELIDIAKRRVKINAQSAQFLVASAYATGLRPNSVDVVFGEAILHHLDLEAAAAEIRRVLRPGGYAVFQEPLRDSALMRFLRRLVPRRGEEISPWEYPLNRKQLDRFARGYRLSSSRRFLLPPTRLALIARWEHPRLFEADRWLLSAAPWTGHFATTVVFRMDT
jgi:SAM-dependent methyltransferase